MRRVLLLLFIFFALCGRAQNYHCLQAGVKHYFTNANGYLRGIRIDSVKSYADSTVFFPVHTPRGSYSMSTYPMLDSNGGSWLGKRVVQRADGTFIFDSYWNDSVIIRTQANVGDSWTFYQDTGSLYYRATVLAEDTLTVLSALDSVKRIMINAYNGSGLVTSDPSDSIIILLSKNHGFVQVVDLYTFPYHKPDSAYRTGLDFFLDESGYGPRGNTIFNLVDFIIPNDQQLHNWDIGDVIESSHGYTPLPMASITNTDYIIDTVVSKVVTPHATNYVLGGTYYSCLFITPCLLISNAVAYTFTDNYYPIVDTNYLPESHFPPGDIVYYFPNDTSHCLASPLYVIVPVPIGFWETDYKKHYKLGIGMTYYEYNDWGDGLFEKDDLIYSSFHGVSCGTFHPNSVPEQSISPKTVVFPCPAQDIIWINAGYPINSVDISNTLGQTIRVENDATSTIKIDIGALPSGVYFVKINGMEVRKVIKE